MPKLAAECGTAFGVEGAESGYGAAGVVTIETQYEDHGQPCEALFQDKDRTVILRVVLTRDDAQRLIKEESFSGDQPPFSFDRMIESVPPEERAATEKALSQLFGSHRPIHSTTYSYDAKGRQVERHQRWEGLSEERTTRRFDDHDNPIHEITEGTSQDLEPDASGNLQSKNPKSRRFELRYDYRYDSVGNWIERVVSMRLESNPDFQPSNIVRREILYFPPRDEP